MKWTLLSVAVALLGMVGTANAGPVQHGNCGPEKACGCAPACQPICCKPVICRPQCHNVCTYQRHCCKPEACGLSDPGCCAPRNHRPSDPGCCPKPNCCPVDPGCCAPICRPVDPGCCPKPNCHAANPNCHAVKPGCCPKPNCHVANPGCCPKPHCSPVDPGCCPKPNGKACAPHCGTSAPPCGTARQNNGACCGGDASELAHWIYISQTACYAKQRAKAVGVLGARFDCRCNPEIMCAFIYALNDCDERVRYRAAREIYRQLQRSNCCCLSCDLVNALTCALGDCDRYVARTAERALIHCGFEVGDGQACSPAMAYVASLSNCGPAGSGPGCGPAACGVGGHQGPGPASGKGPGPAANAGPGADAGQPDVLEDTTEGVDVPAPEKDEPTTLEEKKTEAAPAPAPAPAAGTEPEAYFPSKLKSQSKSTRKSGLAHLFGQR